MISVSPSRPRRGVPRRVLVISVFNIFIITKLFQRAEFPSCGGVPSGTGRGG